jgi:hypothetical protein
MRYIETDIPAGMTCDEYRRVTRPPRRRGLRRLLPR